MEEKKNETMQNPLDKYRSKGYPRQKQPAPGVQSEMEPVPDCGEETYRGSGKLEGRKALVTGGDSGIGRAAAIAFSREGADIVINYMESEQKDAQEVADLLQGEGRKVVLMPGDLSNEEFCKELVERTVSELGGLDIIANVAGMQVSVEDIMDLPTEQLRKTFETNVYQLFWITKAALPHLQPGSSIINTASIQSYKPSPNLLDYAATKAAIVAFTRGLAIQIADKGIRVNAIAPGPIWTALEVSGGQPTSALPKFGQSTPLKRSGQPAELAATYVLLASEDSSYTTAEVYGITGGDHTF